MSEQQKAYEVLQQQYQLPTYQDFDAEFDLQDIEHMNLKALVHIQSERLAYLQKITEELLHPDGGLMSMMEASVPKNQEALLHLFQHICYHIRKAQEVLLRQEGMDSFIKQVYEIYPQLRKELATYIGDAAQFWKQEKQTTHNPAYFG
ncbi:MAG: hypothetical protein ACMXYC_03290 [Candidatus Woesearchaeota archaeon]